MSCMIIKTIKPRNKSYKNCMRAMKISHKIFLKDIRQINRDKQIAKEIQCCKDLDSPQTNL